MQCLNKLAAKEHRRNHLDGEQLHVEAFSHVQMRFSILFYATCEKTVCPIIRARRIAAERVKKCPFSAAIPGFLQQFALCACKR